MDGVRLTPPMFVRPLPALDPGWPERLMVLVFVHMVLDRGRRTLVKPDVIPSSSFYFGSGAGRRRETSPGAPESKRTRRITSSIGATAPGQPAAGSPTGGVTEDGAPTRPAVCGTGAQRVAGTSRGSFSGTGAPVLVRAIARVALKDRRRAPFSARAARIATISALAEACARSVVTLAAIINRAFLDRGRD